MRRMRVLVGILAILLTLTAIGFAQDTGVPDTVYIGSDGTAFGYSGGAYRIPIYVNSDQSIQGLSIGIIFGLGMTGQVFDSVSTANSVFWTHQYFDLTNFGLMVGTSGDDQVNPDTIGFMGASMNKPLPPGIYRLCDLFFHGANVGDQIVVDTGFYPPAGRIAFIPFVTEGGWDDYVPEFKIQPLTIVPNVPDQPEFFSNLPAVINGTSGIPLSFSFSASASHNPTLIVFDSLRNAATGARPIGPPVCQSGNPVNFSWYSLFWESGDWTAFFTFRDADLNLHPVTTTLSMSRGQSMGDVNCDDVVDVSDVVFLINYIFSPGAPAPCIKQ